MKKYITLTFLIPFITSSAFSQQVVDEAELIRQQGLQNIQQLDSTIHVQLIYASVDNFLKENIYGSLTQAFLQPKAAQMLVKAQQELKKQNARLSLIVYDAARPQRMQVKMYEKVRGTPQVRYVTSPGRKSMHSYGVAVDLSIIDEKTGKELDMGTPVDFLGAKAEPQKESELLKSGQLSQKQIDNRALLRTTMRKAGYRGIPNEWWHFEACTRKDAEATYKPIK